MSRDPPIVGIYNEWTFAAASDFHFHGIILEPAEPAETAVRQLLSQIEGKGIRHIRPLAKYVPKSGIRSLKIQNLANQMLFDS